MVAVLQPPKPTRRPILIDEACKILGKAKPTVYTLSRLGEIPSCRQGRKVYFYEDELLEYFNSGKVTTAREIRETAENALRQIEEKNYDAELLARGIQKEQIRHLGFAFSGKRVLIEQG